ncbi:hypothetical protein MMC13_000188 [Lambiella insularis]|nr:hypothetical protein [Lambiella insularis]
MPLQKIAIIGANGILGPSVLRALLSAHFTVSVLSRASSKSTYPSSVHQITIPDDVFSQPREAAIAALTTALRGQDALIVTIAGSHVDEQVLLADACVAAGVKRMMPADFGSCDSADEYTLELLPLFKGKARVRRHLQSLAEKAGGTFSWTAIISGHFFDYGLGCRLLQVDLAKRTATIFDGGNIKFSASNLDTIGLAVTRVLQKEEVTKDRLLYVQSVHITQNEVLAALEEATGEKWKVTHAKSEDAIAEHKVKAYEGDADAIEEIVSVHGIVASDWVGKEDFANEMLGLEAESLDETVTRVLHEKR